MNADRSMTADRSMIADSLKTGFRFKSIVNAILISTIGLICVLSSGLSAVAFEQPLGQPLKQPNVLLICVDDLRPELNCFGVDYIHSPNIDRLAKTGAAFTRHYVQAPTCGSSRAALLTGRYAGRYAAASNSALFQRAKAIKKGETVTASMPAWFRNNGYTTVSVGKVSHHPGGRGGSDWDDDQELEMPNSWDRNHKPAGAWQHPKGWMHGLANGEIRVKRGEMDVFQSLEGDDTIYPDGISTDTALKELDTLAADSKPFFLAVGILRPHLPFGAPAKYMEHYKNATLPATRHPEKPSGKTTWHKSGEFMNYNRWDRNPNEDAEFAIEVRKHYAACVTFADAQVGRVLERLEKTGEADNTVVVLWGDHGWHLGEHALWGKHALFEESLRSPLIIRYPDMANANSKTQSIVESIDIFPTLCELAKLPVPEFVDGTTLKPLIDGGQTESREAISYFRKARTIRSTQYRLIAHKDGHQELYAHGSEIGEETKNLASEKPDVVIDLMDRLNKRIPK